MFFEDIDKVVSEDPAELSRLLDEFDGLDTKNQPLIVVMTTNHVDKLPKGMMRPGRIDAAIELQGFDDEAMRKLVLSLLPSTQLDPDIEWVGMAAEFNGMTPAFAAEAVQRAALYLLAAGNREGLIGREELVGGAKSMADQLALMEQAHDIPEGAELTRAFGDLVDGRLSEHRVDGMSGQLVQFSTNGHH